MYTQKGHILGSIGVAAAVLGLFAVLSVVLDVDRYCESRLLFAPGMRLWVEGPMWVVMSAIYGYVVWWACFRRDGDSTWLTGVGTKVGFGVTMLCFCSPMWSAFSVVAYGAALAMATTPAQMQGVVESSGASIPYRGTRQGIAHVRTTGGRKIELVDFDDVYTRHGKNVMLVNGTCDLARLQPGTVLTMVGRTSSLGFAIDAITTPGMCDPR